MNLLQRYKRLSVWNKLGFWGAAASIIAVPLSLFLYRLSVTNQSDDLPVYGQPFSVFATNDYFEVQTQLKNTLWTGRVSGRVAKAEVVDLKEDGSRKVLIGVGTGGSDTGKVIAYDHRGNIMWTCDTSASFNYDGARGGKLYVVDFVVDSLLGKKGKQVVVISKDDQGWYQARVCMIDTNGEFLWGYWNPGVLGHVKTGAETAHSNKRIVVGGINNDLSRFKEDKHYVYCVFMLDPRTAQGEAPPYLGRSTRGTELWYGLLPGGEGIHSLDILDANDDRRNEIYVWTGGGNMFCIDFQGRVIKRGKSDGAAENADFVLFSELKTSHKTSRGR